MRSDCKRCSYPSIPGLNHCFSCGRPHPLDGSNQTETKHPKKRNKTRRKAKPITYDTDLIA